MRRGFIWASAAALAITAAFWHGSGLGSSVAKARGAAAIPAGLAHAIHARLGAGALRSTLSPGVAPPGRPRCCYPGPELGFSVSLSADGTTALVGAYNESSGRGAAYVFHVSDAGSWTASRTLTATLMKRPGLIWEQWVGYSVALSADGMTAFVGAPAAAVRVGGKWRRSGAVYVFHVASDDAWASSFKPPVTLTVRGVEDFGDTLAVSADGTTLVAWHFIFHAPSEAAWASTSTPTAVFRGAYIGPDGTVAISADGTTALLSDAEDGDGGAYVYHVATESAWKSTSKPTAVLTDLTKPHESLGQAVALSGDGTVAFLGDWLTRTVEVFHSSGEDAWASTSTPTATLTDDALGDFGSTVAVSSDGTTALIGSPTLHGYRGGADLFRASGEGAWVSSSEPTARLANVGMHVMDADLHDGIALSADGSTALVGAPGVQFETGAADIFHVADWSSWGAGTPPTAILTVSALHKCVVPELLGRTVIGAKRALEARGCRLGKVSQAAPEGVETGHVVSQSYGGNGEPNTTRVPLGTRVAVAVAR
jgi:hypothetical protein